MIGGDYYLTTPGPVEDSLGKLLIGNLGNISFFASGRDALTTLLASLPQVSVSLPDLMCASVYDACRTAGKKCDVYRIGSDFLHENTTTLTTAHSIIFVMHYFGVRNETLIRQARNAGSTVISDVTHLLFDRVGLLEVARHSNFLLASLRKSGPFPDGGSCPAYIIDLLYLPAVCVRSSLRYAPQVFGPADFLLNKIFPMTKIIIYSS